MLTVESLVGELELELACGDEAAQAHVRWVHVSELVDPTPWLRGGELLLTTGIQLDARRRQRELVAGWSSTTSRASASARASRTSALPAALRDGRAQARVPAVRGALRDAVHRDHRARVRAAGQRALEMLQRTMAGDVLAEALTGHLYPEELQARLRPFGIGEQVAVLAFALERPDAPAAAPLERAARGASSVRAASVAIRAGPAVRGDRRATGDGIRSSWRAQAARRAARALRRGARAVSRAAPTHSLRLSFHEARCALEAVRLRTAARRRSPRRGSRRLPAAALAAGRRRAASYCHGVLGPIERARATTATSCCARWRRSSSTTATGRRRRARCSATATRCATAWRASRS